MGRRVHYRSGSHWSDDMGAVMRRAWLAALLLPPLSLAQEATKPRLDTEGKVLLAAQASVAIADYWTTTRGLRYGGYEANPLLANRNGRLHGGKFAALNGAQHAGTYYYETRLKHKLPPWAQWTMRVSTWGGGVFFRGWIVTRNYSRGNRLINSQY